MESFALQHVDLRPETQWDRKPAKPLLIWASAEMQ